MLRSLIKGHLVPALSRVASHLLAQMTGGQRSVVVVDQEFDVTVDGQRLDTLSGSGKAVANLALPSLRVRSIRTIHELSSQCSKTSAALLKEAKGSLSRPG